MERDDSNRDVVKAGNGESECARLCKEGERSRFPWSNTSRPKPKHAKHLKESEEPRCKKSNANVGDSKQDMPSDSMEHPI